MLATATLPPLLVLPITLLMMVIVAAHTSSVARSDHPPSRKRIRQANGFVMLLLLPTLAAGFSIISPQTHPKLFTLVWLLAIPLLGMTVLLAGMDWLNTIRLRRADQERLRRSLREALAELRSRSGSQEPSPLGRVGHSGASTSDEQF